MKFEKQPLTYKEQIVLLMGAYSELCQKYLCPSCQAMEQRNKDCSFTTSFFKGKSMDSKPGRGEEK